MAAEAGKHVVRMYLAYIESSCIPIGIRSGCSARRQKKKAWCGCKQLLTTDMYSTTTTMCCSTIIPR